MDSEGAIVIVMIMVLLVFVGAAGYGAGREDGIKKHQIESVKRGHGRWVVDHEGHTTFRWNEIGAVEAGEE